MADDGVSEAEVDRLVERLRAGDELRCESEVFQGVSEPFIHVSVLRYDPATGAYEHEYGGEGYPDEVPPRPYAPSRVERVDEGSVRALLRAGGGGPPYRAVSRSARSA